jgi:hypothetical protein
VKVSPFAQVIGTVAEIRFVTVVILTTVPEAPT